MSTVDDVANFSVPSVIAPPRSVLSISGKCAPTKQAHILLDKIKSAYRFDLLVDQGPQHVVPFPLPLLSWYTGPGIVKIRIVSMFLYVFGNRYKL